MLALGLAVEKTADKTVRILTYKDAIGRCQRLQASRKGSGYRRQWLLPAPRPIRPGRQPHEPGRNADAQLQRRPHQAVRIFATAAMISRLARSARSTASSLACGQPK